MRKNPSLSRNGGSDAEIMELNQQVGLPRDEGQLYSETTSSLSLCAVTHCFLSPVQVDGAEVDCRRTREGERLLLQQTTGH